MADRRVEVFGPAYLDRVLRVSGPMLDDCPLDQSAEGAWKFGDGDSIAVESPDGFVLEIRLPSDWTGPRGSIRLREPIREGLAGHRVLEAVAAHDDLGGMGAGFASALGGALHSALGPESDPTSRAIEKWAAQYGLRHRPIRVPDREADWTLLVTSGEHGDKLAIGFRGCHAALDPEDVVSRAGPCDLRIVAAWPNRLVGPLLRAPGARTRFFAPSLRNMADRDEPLTRFADRIDLISNNRKEWETLADRESVASTVPIVIVTDGPSGAEVRFRDAGGTPRQIHVPAFPRSHPPRDTNRAGEAFASTFLATLLDHGWDGAARVVDEGRIRLAAERAAAASALELDLSEFAFPTSLEIDAALRDGRVPGP